MNIKNSIFYNKETGIFTWISGRRKGKIAGYKTSDGYVCININNKNYLAHVLAFLWMGFDRPEQIDHINRIKSDNRWSNLRVSNNSLNQINTGLSSRNKTGYKGVSFRKDRDKYVASSSYRENGKIIHKHLGYFDCPKEANEAYKKFIIEKYGTEYI